MFVATKPLSSRHKTQVTLFLHARSTHSCSRTKSHRVPQRTGLGLPAIKSHQSPSMAGQYVGKSTSYRPEYPTDSESYVAQLVSTNMCDHERWIDLAL